VRAPPRFCEASRTGRNPLEFKDGRLTVPTGPGLGLELDENKLREMRVKD